MLWRCVCSGLGSRILYVEDVRVLLGMFCGSVALRSLEMMGSAEVPWEYILTPWKEVMMLVGAV